MKERHIIAAVAKDGAIGNKGGLLWDIKADLKHFKELTTGNIVIMGRKTYESIGRPLPNRQNIIVTSRNIEFPEGTNCYCVRSLAEAFKLAEKLPGEKSFVIGGGQLYKEAIDWVDTLDITELFGQPYEADTYFPEIPNCFLPVKSSERYMCSTKLNIPAFRFTTYKRHLIVEAS